MSGNFYFNLIISLLCIMFVTLGKAQTSNFTLRLLPLDKDITFLQKEIKFQTTFPDSTAVIRELQYIIHQLHQRAYLEASVDTLLRLDTIFAAIMHIGQPYEWIALNIDSVDHYLLNESGFRDKLFSKKPFSPAQLTQLQENLLTAAENKGYPFAQIKLDSFRFDNQGVSAKLLLYKNQLVLLDKIEVQGNVKLSDIYLSNYLGIKLGAPYDRSRILRMRQRLRELTFINMTKDPVINFAGDRAAIQLFLEKRRASRFDFLIGVLPNSAQTGKMLITGSFNGELYNQFGRGERIYAEFEALRPQTQELNTQFNYPYLLNLPFGIDAKFNLYKRDTTYLDIETDLGVQYLLEGGNYFKVFWNNRRSNLLSVDSLLNNVQRLPPQLDVGYGNFGLEYAFQQLDYRYNPRQGWNLLVRGAAGVKQIRRNNRLESFSNENFYDSLELRTFQYRAAFRAERFMPVFSRSTLKLGAQGAYIFSKEPIYLNEQYRIGGNRLLRGFDEEFVFATAYTIGTLEYRLLIGQNSYLYLFGDYGYVEDVTVTNRDYFQPFGFGAGITFETRAGLFGVSLAYGGIRGAQGARANQAVDFGAPKVHFGYISLF
ncbi:MAG: POTRA domain-containing protein [Saprospiraceae bacterium]